MFELALALYVHWVLSVTEVGPVGVEIDTAAILTVREVDQADTIEVYMASLAITLTKKVPPVVQVLEALVPDCQPELVPSPQSKKYWTGSPILEVAPPVI